jgi:CDGSH iron-sulfur domain-containing protein 1
MPRLIRHTLNGPIKIEPSDKPIWVCACGLSQKFPICDGAHKQCAAREPDPNAEYVYDETRTRVVSVNPPPPPKADDHPHI